MSKERQKTWLVSVPLQLSGQHEFTITADTEDEARAKLEDMDLWERLVSNGISGRRVGTNYTCSFASNCAGFTELSW